MYILNANRPPASILIARLEVPRYHHLVHVLGNVHATTTMSNLSAPLNLVGLDLTALDLTLTLSRAGRSTKQVSRRQPSSPAAWCSKAKVDNGIVVSVDDVAQRVGQREARSTCETFLQRAG